EMECIGYISLTTYATKHEAIAAWNGRTTDAEIERLTKERDEARQEAQFQRGCARMLETEKAHREALVVTLAGPLEAYVRECEKQDIKLGPITGDAVEALSAPEVKALVAAHRETKNG